jgi:translation initiation factor IF-3
MGLRLTQGLVNRKGVIEITPLILLRLAFAFCGAFEEVYAIDKNIRVNHRIRAKEIRVIDDNNEQLGVLTPPQAMKIAEERGLDLVEVAPTANPPVCRIMDYGKYLISRIRRNTKQESIRKNITVKEVKFRPNTDEHDYVFKKNHIIRFLARETKSRPPSSSGTRNRAPEHRRRIIDRLIEELAEVGAWKPDRKWKARI